MKKDNKKQMTHDEQVQAMLESGQMGLMEEVAVGKKVAEGVIDSSKEVKTK